MNGNDGMPNTPNLSEAKRVLLEKYLQGRSPQVTTSAATIARRNPESSPPLSYGQQQLWLLAQFISDTPVYTECVTNHLPGEINISVLEQSFNEILKRHEAWRTSFPVVDGQPIQKIRPVLTIKLPLVDLRHHPEAEREHEALRMMTEDAQKPFDMANGPLLRPTLIQIGDTDYRLFLTLHHIIFDGFSLYQIFLPELRTLYDACLSGQPSPLPELPIQYADFTVWQREQLQGNIFAEQLAFWKKQLEGAPGALELPTDRPRPLIANYHGSMHPFALSKQLTDDLKALGRQEGVTFYMLLVAAFQTLLYRYTAQDDILIGTAISDRKRPEVQGLMGFFLNTLVLRTDLSGNPTFREVLRRVREVVLDAHAHPDIPFEYLVKELQPERNLSQNPFFQVLLSLEPPLFTHPSGWTLTQMDVETETTKFDLTLELDDRPEGLIGRFEYSTDLFDAATIARMAGHWQTLLEGIVMDPTRRLSDLPILTEAERQLLLVEWNNTAIDYPLNLCLHELFEAQVERTPDAVAMIFEDTHLTYRELNARANQVAHYLRRAGVGPDVLVGVYMERSLELVIALLSIIKAGGAYIPLDPTYPQERLSFMLEDAQVRVLLTQERWITTLPAHCTRVLCLDSGWKDVAHEGRTNLSNVVTPDNLAYVIYTSGSTGKPKGAMNTHRGICNRLLWMQDAYQLTEADRVLQKTPFTFDVSVWEFFWPLITGAQLVVARPEGHKDSAYLISIIMQQKITTLHFVPSMFQVFLEEPGLEECHSLQQVICSGEALPFEVQERYFARHNGALHNLYGPTEAAIDVTFWHCKRNSERKIVPIGYPIANIHIYLLDRHGHPVPIGVPGELHIGGVGVARGYLNRPELTNERFIPNPFSSTPGERLYKTGDLARYLPDGSIEYLGRIDHQVKMRGFRIELGEIEEILRQYPAVRETVIVVREDIPGDKRLVAYIVPHMKQSISIGDLHTHLTTYLPAYMIPSAYVVLEGLPLTHSGKVNRRALPLPDQTRPELQETFVAPRTPMEEAVAAIWSQVLKIEGIGIYDNFFKLGGHSLLATQVLSHLRATLQVDVSLRNFFEAPTIAQLSTIIKYQQASGTEYQKSVGPAIRALSREAHRVILSSISTARDSSSSRN